MDWLWPLYQEYVERQFRSMDGDPSQSVLQQAFLRSLGQSTATLYVMEPVGDTIRFKGLGRWQLPKVPDLLADPNGFIAARYGGGKFKLNFHHGFNFVGTHNFRTWGEETWRQAPEIEFELD
jgi:hypothetical protein